MRLAHVVTGYLRLVEDVALLPAFKVKCLLGRRSNIRRCSFSLLLDAQSLFYLLFESHMLLLTNYWILLFHFILRCQYNLFIIYI